MKKNVLLSTLGWSPKTITEMFKALEFKGVNINEIHAIATKNSITLPEKFRPEGVSWHEHSCPVADVRSEEDAISMSNLIFQTLKSLKERDDIDKLFMDLTGGRKTMSSYLMAAAQLLCTEEDELYHVETNDTNSPLTNKNHEKFAEYYYPQSEDEITLIRVPFVSLRPLFEAVGMVKEDSLWEFLNRGREGLQKLSFCGLIGAGIEHQAAPLIGDAYSNAPQIKGILKEIEGILKQFPAVLRNTVKQESINIRNFMNEAKTIIERRIPLDFLVEDNEDVKIIGDDILFLQVMTILAKNAFKHGDATKIIVNWKTKDGKLILSFSDNGDGMSESVSKELFCPFKSYKVIEDGKQVGLPVAKKLMAACGGDIDIEKSNEKGTTFILSFKLA